MKATVNGRTSLRGLARRLHVNESKIRKAIDSGRLEESVDYSPNGQPFIADPTLAEQEWEDNRDPARARARR